MTNKTLLFAICVLFLAACQPDLETIEITARPTLTATVLATDTATSAASPTPTATSTAVPPTPFPTITNTPTPTAAPTAVLPSASVLFVRDDALQQWIPQTGEVKTLVENVTRDIIYSADVAVFLREITPDQEYVLIVFHIPTQSEYELFRTSVTPLVGLYDETVSISPNGRWLAYVSGDLRDSATITVHKIVLDNQQVSVRSPVFTVTPGAGWNWPYDQLTWPTENELSWSDRAGIWVADLSANLIEPGVAIAPSTNTFLFAPVNSADAPFTAFTTFIPYHWSPDGRYLIVIEDFDESGAFRVIERGTNRSFEVSESGIGPISDTAVWLNETALVHLGAFAFARIWRINPGGDPFLSLEKTIPLQDLWAREQYVLPMNGHIRFLSYEPECVYDLDLETGELIELSQGVPSIFFRWSLDGQHALWSDSVYSNGERFGHVFLDYLNGDKPVEMESVFGLDSCCWHWYEE